MPTKIEIQNEHEREIAKYEAREQALENRIAELKENLSQALKVGSFIEDARRTTVTGHDENHWRSLALMNGLNCCEASLRLRFLSKSVKIYLPGWQKLSRVKLTIYS